MAALGAAAAGATLGWLVRLMMRHRATWNAILYSLVHSGAFAGLALWAGGLRALVAFAAGETVGFVAQAAGIGISSRRASLHDESSPPDKMTT